MCSAGCYRAKLSVREFVEFMCRTGNLDNRGRATDPWAMAEGIRLHQKIQSNQPEFYSKEVCLSHETLTEVDGEVFSVVLEGRADGVYDFAQPSDKFEADNKITAMFESMVFVDEIKCMYADVDGFTEPEKLHLAQAKCYAWFLICDRELDRIGVQITYCNLETEKIRYFTNEYTKEELEQWYQQLIDGYVKWMYWEKHHVLDRDASVKKMEFPFEYREGQKELVKNVYLTLLRSKKIYIEAPTGVGKTISTLFPAVKALGEGLIKKIFYTTARTITRTVAEEAFSVMRSRGAGLLTITITAKEKLCVLYKPDCNPLSCPRARGHEDRVNGAVYDLITHETEVDRETILKYAEKHQVCPFEFSLDVALWCDAIICDYNYCFNPDVYFRRFFNDSNIKSYALLVDEAHNLVDRAREMYSAVLDKGRLLEVKKQIKGREDIRKLFNKVNRTMLDIKRCCVDEITLLDYDEEKKFFKAVHELYNKLSAYVTDRKITLPDGVLDFYFEIRYFVMTVSQLDEHYLIRSEIRGDEMQIVLGCMNPKVRLKDYLRFHRSTIFFSATLLPVKYYMEQLSGTEDDYAVYAPSPFDISKRKILVATDVSAKYTRRNEQEYKRIASYIKAMIDAKTGNYLIFFPSYKVLEAVYEILGESGMDLICQSASMTEEMREDFLAAFEDNPTETHVGFCVMGGIFSEGIDLKANRLIGVAVVGTGLPMVGPERELFREYYQEMSGNGFECAYLYPGMNKVLQAGGRVIRTAEDVGVILLLDDRFTTRQYNSLFPYEWRDYKVTNINKVSREMKEFWENKK
ncbi:MAG: ATP-dependent DNA helicase [Lachnospiraceae bacterium]